MIPTLLPLAEEPPSIGLIGKGKWDGDRSSSQGMLLQVLEEYLYLSHHQGCVVYPPLHVSSTAPYWSCTGYPVLVNRSAGHRQSGTAGSGGGGWSGSRYSPLVVLVLMTSIALAIILGIMEVCDLFAEQSERIQRWIQRIDARTKEITYLRTYGALMLIPIIWVPGIALYGTPLVAWIFRWDRGISIFCMITGWIVATGLVMGTTLGLVHIIF